MWGGDPHTPRASSRRWRSGNPPRAHPRQGIRIVSWAIGPLAEAVTARTDKA
jgi:hypothetical protein